MFPLIFILLSTTPQDLKPLDMAESLKTEGRLLEAEGYYLGTEPLEEDIVRTALGLTEVSLRIGNSPARVKFFQSQLNRSPNWRGVALFVLSGLAAGEHDWKTYGENALLFIKENPTDHPVLYRMLFLLARYTGEDISDVTLPPAARSWFDSCRALPADQWLPTQSHDATPFTYAYLHLLASENMFETPEPPGQDPIDEHVVHLLNLRRSLLEGNDVDAAHLINRISPRDKELNRADLRLLFYPLMRDYFLRRDLADRASVVEANMKVLQRWAVFPMGLYPDELRKVPPPETPSEPTPEVEPPPEPEVVSQADPEPDTPEQEAVTQPTPEEAQPSKPDKPTQSEKAEEPATGPEAFLELERKLMLDPRGLELSIFDLPGDTTYRKIYRNYLSGLYYLRANRLDKSYERLSVAEAMVVDYPFPNLEVKILMALGQYYQQNDKPDKAQWYRLSALQVWNAPENLPIFVAQANRFPIAPGKVLIDRALDNVRADDAIHKLLYYSETDHFVRLTRRAYHRKALNVNPVLDNQLHQIGTQVADLVDSLAQNPSSTPNPRRYNNTLEIWNKLWKQVIPYYRQPAPSSVAELRQVLNLKDRVISFVEGERKLGVLFLSKNQAFAISLGTRGAFLALDENERIGFLAARLGPIWDHDGTLVLNLSPTFRQTDLISRVRAKMEDPSDLHVVFSIKAMTATRERGDCRNIVVFSGEHQPTLLDLETDPSERLERVSLSNLSRSSFENSLESNDHLIYAGPLVLGDSGLVFGNEQSGFLFHEMIHFNPQLCSLTVVADEPSRWGPLLNELELINPSAAMTINLAVKDTEIKNTNLSARQGVHFP